MTSRHSYIIDSFCHKAAGCKGQSLTKFYFFIIVAVSKSQLRVPSWTKNLEIFDYSQSIVQFRKLVVLRNCAQYYVKTSISCKIFVDFIIGIDELRIL